MNKFYFIQCPLYFKDYYISPSLFNKSVDPDFLNMHFSNILGRWGSKSESLCEDFQIVKRKVNMIDPNRFFFLEEWYKVQLGDLRSISIFSHRSSVIEYVGIRLELGDHKKARLVSVQGSIRTVRPISRCFRPFFIPSLSLFPSLGFWRHKQIASLKVTCCQGRVCGDSVSDILWRLNFYVYDYFPLCIFFFNLSWLFLFCFIVVGLY